MKISTALLFALAVFSTGNAYADEFAKVEGIIVQKVINKGSHSESLAIGIQQKGAEEMLVVRMQGDNPFLPNQEMQKNLGKQAYCEGFLIEPNRNVLVEAICVFNN